MKGKERLAGQKTRPPTGKIASNWHDPHQRKLLMKLPRLFPALPRVILAVVSAALLAACGTPGPPKPMRSAKIGPKPVSVKPDGLRSWTETSPARLALTTFVDAAVKSDSTGYVPPADRVAVFSDRVLWVGQPAAPAFAGETTEAYAAAARTWLRSTRNSASGRPVASSAFGPVKETLAYLRANGFKIYVVSGGDPTLTRLFAEEAYGLSHEQVVGADVGHAYEVRSGSPVIVRRPDAGSRAVKPVALYHAAAQRPVIAFGAGDDDLELLEYATLQNPRASVAFVLRSGAADAQRLASAASARGWRVIDAASDWTASYAD